MCIEETDFDGPPSPCLEGGEGVLGAGICKKRGKRLQVLSFLLLPLLFAKETARNWQSPFFSAQTHQLGYNKSRLDPPYESQPGEERGETIAKKRSAPFVSMAIFE